MAITSFLAMLFTYQPDWQSRPLKFSARYTSSMESAERLSQPEDCTKVSVEEINSKLQLAENVFSELAPEPFYRSGICLPPNAAIRIERRVVVIQTDYCDINVEVKNSGVQMSGQPQLIRPGQPRSIISENLPDGRARYTNMPIPMEIHVRYKPLYATHRDMEKIKAWVGRLTAGIHIWFEGSGQDFQRLRSPLESSAKPATNPQKDIPATHKSTPSAPEIP